MKRKAILMFALVLAVCLLGAGLVFAGGKQESGGKMESSGAKESGKKMPKKIGYVTNYAMHEWYQNVMAGMRDRAKQIGVDLEIIDANLDMAKEVSAAEDLISKGVDVLIITPVDQKGAEPILRKAKAEGIPVVIEASPVEGMTTLVAICDYDAGYKGGAQTAKYLKDAGVTTAKVMAIDLPALRPCILRVDGFLDGLKDQGLTVQVKHRLDGQGLKDKALQVATDALTADPDVNVIYGCNDDSALGAYQAYKAAGLDESKLIVCGTGCEGIAAIEALKADNAYKVESAMFPEKVGFECIDMAVRLYNGEKVPEHWVTPTFALTADNWNKYYKYENGKRTIIWDAVNSIPTEDKCGKY